MKNVIPPLSVALVVSFLFNACSPKGWKMDYGKPAAQFEQRDVAAKGKDFVGKKITVRGTVTKTDVSNPKEAWVYLSNGVRCNFGKFTAMAEGYEVGEQIYVDGFLKSCEDGDVLIDPAIGRDPKASFEPLN